MEGKLNLHVDADTAAALVSAVKTNQPLVLVAFDGEKMVKFRLAATSIGVTTNSPIERMWSASGQECSVSLGLMQLIETNHTNVHDLSAVSTADKDHVRDAIEANR